MGLEGVERLEGWWLIVGNPESWENSGSLRLSTQNSLTRLWRTQDLTAFYDPEPRQPGTINSDSERGGNLQLNNVCWVGCWYLGGGGCWEVGGVVCYRGGLAWLAAESSS